MQVLVVIKHRLKCEPKLWGVFHNDSDSGIAVVKEKIEKIYPNRKITRAAASSGATSLEVEGCGVGEAPYFVCHSIEVI